MRPCSDFEIFFLFLLSYLRQFNYFRKLHFISSDGVSDWFGGIEMDSHSISDSQSFARLQEALRESKRQVDKQRERIVALETSRKQMESDLAELQE